MGENDGQEGKVWGHGMAFIVMVRQRKGIFRRGSNLEGIVMARFPFSPGLVEGGFLGGGWLICWLSTVARLWTGRHPFSVVMVLSTGCME